MSIYHISFYYDFNNGAGQMYGTNFSDSPSSVRFNVSNTAYTNTGLLPANSFQTNLGTGNDACVISSRNEDTNEEKAMLVFCKNYDTTLTSPYSGYVVWYIDKDNNLIMEKGNNIFNKELYLSDEYASAPPLAYPQRLNN